MTVSAPTALGGETSTTGNPTWTQTAAVIGLEVGQQLRGLGAFGLALLALLPSVPWLILWVVRTVTGEEVRVSQEAVLVADATETFAVQFQIFTLPVVLFFACVIVFMGSGRRDIRQKTLHHYLLCPLRRRSLLVGKYLAGLGVSFAFLAGSVVFTFAIAYFQVLSADRFAVEEFFLGGPGIGHLFGYLGAVLLGCIGYGAVFLTLSLYLRNPIIPVVGVFGWEALLPFLPAPLKLISVYHYLRSVCPVPTDEGPFALLAEPMPSWLAVCGVLGVSAVLLALAARRFTALEINYGDE